MCRRRMGTAYSIGEVGVELDDYPRIMSRCDRFEAGVLDSARSSSRVDDELPIGVIKDGSYQSTDLRSREYE
jgi:hypothetical protein